MPFDHEAEHRDIENRSNANRRRLLDLSEEYHRLANRIHKLEDHFDTGGIIEQLSASLYELATRLEELINTIEGSHGR